MKKVALLSTLIFLLSVSSVFAIESGWWWNPDEDGRGYNIEIHGNSLYMAWYAYEQSNREPTWIVSWGTMSDATHFTAPVWRYENGQCIGCPYHPPDYPTNVGTISITFQDDSHGIITYGSVVVPIERFRFNDEPTTLAIESGWWWNPAEDGRGFNIEIQGYSLYMAWYAYDEATGQPTWIVAWGNMSTDTQFTAWMWQYDNGQCIGCPYHPPNYPTIVGTISITFRDNSHALIIYSSTSGRIVKMSIERFTFGTQ